MKTRLLTSLYIFIALVVAFVSRFITPYIFDAIVGFLAVAGVVEVARVLERTKKYSSINLVGLMPGVLYVGLFLAFFYEWNWANYLLVYLITFLFFVLLSFVLTLALPKHTNREMKKYGVDHSRLRYAADKALNTGFVFVYPTVLFSSLFLLNHLGQISFIANKLTGNVGIFATFILLLTVVITVCCDSLAMLVGMTLKGPKLFPIISPKKTISGAVGGLLGSLLSALLLYWLFGFNSAFVSVYGSVAAVGFIIFIGLFGGVVSQAGDVFASYLKRRARVKDYGTIFPGHGGVMDRYDSLIFTATFVFISVFVLVLI